MQKGLYIKRVHWLLKYKGLNRGTSYKLAPAEEEAGVKSHLIGGAYEASELDAKRAIHQACTLAAEI
jgi:hypothetical protein